jgi:hypothetical protein
MRPGQRIVMGEQPPFIRRRPDSLLRECRKTISVAADGPSPSGLHAQGTEAKERTMKRFTISTGALALAAAALLAAPASGHLSNATLTIQHQMRGCHAWSFNGGAYKASLRITVARGTTLKVIDNDMMPHKLIQLAGPKAKLISPAMKHMSAQAKVVFSKRGTYRFTTRAGEDYPSMGAMKTIGEDNVLRLTVTVS